MKKSKLFLISALFLGAVVSCDKVPMQNITELISPTGDITTFTTANNSGNVTCDEVALATGCSFENTSGRMDYLGGGGGTYGPITWTTDGTYVNWSSTVPVKIAIIVKGGPTASVYFSGCDADACTTTGTALSAPINPANGKPYGLSNITFCYSECKQQTQLVVAFKGFMYVNEGYWSVTGGGPDWNYFIGYYPLTSGSYPIYMWGLLDRPAGTLEVGNFDNDPLLEVRVTSTVSGFYFTNTYLYVGTKEDFNTNYENYPYHVLPASNSTIVEFFDISN